MLKIGIRRGALLLVDRSIDVKNGSIIVAYYKEKWIIRMLVSNQYLSTGPLDKKLIKIDEDIKLIFGVVTWSCNPLIGEGHTDIIKLD